VNAMTVGIARTDKIFYAKAAGVGNHVVYLGSKTGRDGIHGATMASAEFDEKSDEKRPTVQVGDPFVEKLLIEACLELMATDAIQSIQDMGAAGLTSSSFEMASKGGLGVELWLDKVPCRETGMTPYEMMLSESQERMLMILKPGREDLARGIFEKWDLDFAVIGKLTDTGRMVLRFHGETVGELPIDPLAQASPEYDRPWVPTPKPKTLGKVPAVEPIEALQRLMASPDLCSRRWIWEQYDHMVMADTVERPGGDAAVVRVTPEGRALAMTVDCTPRYCKADPVEGGRQVVAEVWRNLNAVGAQPLAITDNLNFGNPQRPEIMGQLVGAIQGMGEACRALDFPVVSGNVSLYNETSGQAILPTPVVGGVGLIDDVAQRAHLGVGPGETLLLLGETRGHLGQSLYLRELCGREEGAPPPVDLAAERRIGDFVRQAIRAGSVSACHDLSDGGLAVAAAEMALAGGTGLVLEPAEGGPPVHGWLFGEDQGRYLVATRAPDKLLEAARKAKVPAQRVGATGGKTLTLPGGGTISLAELGAARESWLPGFMAGELL
jgi:phosphoribosylformylglycinamidine synthase subunit PurL